MWRVVSIECSRFEPDWTAEPFSGDLIGSLGRVCEIERLLPRPMTEFGVRKEATDD
jgi:hypothetical protein